MDKIKKIIAECSGSCGLSMYENLSQDEFITWFRNDIQYNTENSRKLGEKLISYLEGSIDELP